MHSLQNSTPPKINIEPENDGLKFRRLSSNGCISMVMLVFGGVIALICFDNINRITIFSEGDSYEHSFATATWEGPPHPKLM